MSNFALRPIRSQHDEVLIQDLPQSQQLWEYKQREHHRYTLGAENAARTCVKMIRRNMEFAERRLLLDIIRDGYKIPAYLIDYTFELIETQCGKIRTIGD